MKLMNMDYTLKSLQTFKQNNDMATLNIGGRKANAQSRRKLEAGATVAVQGRDDECLNKSRGTGHGERIKLQEV